MVKLENLANLILIGLRSNMLIVLLGSFAILWETIGLDLFLTALFIHKLEILDLSPKMVKGISLIASSLAAIFVAMMFLVLKLRNAAKWTIWGMGILVFAMVFIGNVKTLDWAKIAALNIEECFMLSAAVVITTLSVFFNAILANVVNTIYAEGGGVLNTLQGHFSDNVLRKGEEAFGAKVVKMSNFHRKRKKKII